MKSIYCQPLGGLCNRMRVITGAVELAKILNRKLIIIWTSDCTLNAKFSDLFEPIPYEVIETSLTSISQRLRWHTLTKLLGYKVFDDLWIKNHARNIPTEKWLPLMQNYRIFIYSNLDIILNGDYSIFKPKKIVLEEFNNVNVNKNVIGIHIRRNDNVNAIRFSPTQLFIDRIHEDLRINPNIQYYLATDDPDEENNFIQEFGDSIIIYKKHSLDRNNPLAIKDALIDLYNLSCCNKIYGSYYSSFSDTAALWSGIDKIELKLDK